MATPLYDRGGPYTPKVGQMVTMRSGSGRRRSRPGVPAVKILSAPVNSSQGPLSAGQPADRFPLVPASGLPTMKEILIVRRLTTGLALGAAAATLVAGPPAATARPGPTAAPASSDRQALKLGADEKLVRRSVTTDRDGTTHTRYDRTWKGLRVVGEVVVDAARAADDRARLFDRGVRAVGFAADVAVGQPEELVAVALACALQRLGEQRPLRLAVER